MIHEMFKTDWYFILNGKLTKPAVIFFFLNKGESGYHNCFLYAKLCYPLNCCTYISLILRISYLLFNKHFKTCRIVLKI